MSRRKNTLNKATIGENSNYYFKTLSAMLWWLKLTRSCFFNYFERCLIFDCLLIQRCKSFTVRVYYSVKVWFASKSTFESYTIIFMCVWLVSLLCIRRRISVPSKIKSFYSYVSTHSISWFSLRVLPRSFKLTLTKIVIELTSCSFVIKDLNSDNIFVGIS